MGYQRNKKLSLVQHAAFKQLPNLDAVREVVQGVDAAAREKVIEETREFYRARATGAMSYLAMGDHLSRIRAVLEPLELWKRYCHSLPNMGIATAYRMIWAWENSQRALPAATARVAARDGYRLIANRKDGSFAPGYDRAVEAVQRDLGPAPAEDERKAGEWLQAVVTKKRELSRKLTVTIHMVNVEEQEKRIVKSVMRVIHRLPEDKRGTFVQQVIGMLLTAGEVKKASVRALPLPVELQAA